MLAAGLLIAQQVAARATRDAFFLSQFDVTALPLMTASAAILSLLAVLAFARAIAVLSPARIVPIAVATSATLLIGEWALSAPFPRVAAVVVYCHTALFGATLVSGFWSLINERFDPYSAKRAVGSIGTGASLGGMIGGLITWRAASLGSVPTMLVGLAVLNLLCVPPLLMLRPTARADRQRHTGSPRLDETGASGLRLIRDVPYLRNLAIVIGLGAFIEALVDYVFNAAAAASFGKGGPLMSFFALFHTAVGLLSLALQAVLTRPSLTRLGLAGTMAVQPAALAAGAVLALSFPHLASAVFLRGAQAVLRNSLFRSAYELLYTPLPEGRKRRTKVIVDVGFDRVGTAAGGVAVMAVLVVVSSGSIHVLLALAAASAVLALALTLRFHRGYVAALAESLRTGVVTLDSAEVVDATTRSTVAALDRAREAKIAQAASEERADLAVPPILPDPLLEAIADLASADAQRIRKVVSAAAELDPRLASHVIPLLARDDLFGETVASLRKAAPRCTGQLLDALLDPEQDPVVRRRIPRVLKAVPTQRAADGLLLGLRDERLDLRYRCAQALVRMKEKNAALAISREEVIAAALREIAAGRLSGRSLDHTFSILSLALEREPLEIALRALRTDDDALRGTALEYLDNVLPDRVREALWPQLGSPERVRRSGRSTEEIREDLLRSTAPTTRRAAARKRLPTSG